MEIILNKENQKTYEKVNELFERENRVAVIQPTGTGKTMTALKFLSELKNKKVLYITSFNSTIKDLKDKMEEYDISGSNIQITTYRNLVVNFDINQEFDYIIVDEYHHAGALVTNEKLNEILNRNPNVKLLGLTATPIRYLDNKRDMTEELFNGVVANEMSLEYAIAHKLLPEFSYINALFQEDLNEIIDSYQEEINEIDPNNQKEYLKLLGYLKENIKDLAGINQIFKKYLKSNGKYVVFCENKNQMEDIIKSLRDGKLDWFNGTTNNAYIYSLYYGNDVNINEMNLEGFKNETRDGIKLLFNINMASEGLHFETLDGVIMLRSTTSPNLFIQQLGRALSINTKEEPVIFDLVSNITNENIFNFLSGVGDEVVKGIKNGEDKEEFADIRKIAIHDELKKVREIINKLNRLKVSTWDKNFNSLWFLNEFLVDYKNEFGDPALLEDIDFKKENTYQLDLMFNYINYDIQKWILMQQRLYKNMELRYDRVKKLQAIGLLPRKEKFNETDYEIYESFVKQIKPFEKRVGMKLYEYPLDEQMFLIKEHIDKYYYSRDNQGYTLEDYIQEATLALLNASKTYSKEKGYYPYYVDICIFKQRREFLKFDKFESVNLEDAHSLEDLDSKQKFEQIENFTLYDYMNKALSALSEREEEVIRHRFGIHDGTLKTLQEIGNMYNVSRARISSIESHALRKVRSIFKTMLDYPTFDWIDFLHDNLDKIKEEMQKNIENSKTWPSQRLKIFTEIEKELVSFKEVLVEIKNIRLNKEELNNLSYEDILERIKKIQRYFCKYLYNNIYNRALDALERYINEEKSKGEKSK